MIDMIRRNLSISSRVNSHTFRRHRGFTMVEVMMSVVLIAIGASLALPNYREMVEKRRLTNGAEQLASFVNTVQGISTRTNQIVTVTVLDVGDWCIGASVGEAECDCADESSTSYCRIDAQAFVLNEELLGSSDLVNDILGSGSFSYDPIRGLFTDLDDSLTMELRSPSGDYRLNLMVNNTGRVILCSDDISHSVPGYDKCPTVSLVEVAEATE